MTVAYQASNNQIIFTHSHTWGNNLHSLHSNREKFLYHLCDNQSLQCLYNFIHTMVPFPPLQCPSPSPSGLLLLLFVLSVHFHIHFRGSPYLLAFVDPFPPWLSQGLPYPLAFCLCFFSLLATSNLFTSLCQLLITKVQGTARDWRYTGKENTPYAKTS